MYLALINEVIITLFLKKKRSGKNEKQIKGNEKSRTLNFIIIIICLFCMLGIVQYMICNNKKGNVLELDKLSTEDTLKALYGVWTIDFSQFSEADMESFAYEFRSAYEYGYEMTFSENGDFSYYIGIGIGGEGTYTLWDNKISIGITTYEEGEVIEDDFPIIEKDGKKYIVKDDSGCLIYWVKK